MKKKLTKENWEEEFGNRLVDWNNPIFLVEHYGADCQSEAVKTFIRELVDNLTKKNENY